MLQNEPLSLQAAPPFDEDTYARADWLELYTTLNKVTYYTDIERVWERSRQSENEDYAGEHETTFDAWLEEVIAIIQYRSSVMGGDYPFAINDDDSGVVFITEDELSTGQAVYLLCLFLSVMNEGTIFANLLEISPRHRDLFQACSAWAAAGAIHGSSYAFGWPRPDKTRFHDALKKVFHDLMNDGDAEVHENAPAGASPSDKDGGIDVIAWKRRLDGYAGKPIIIGQVASGANWRDKSVKEYIERLIKNWFSRQPSTECTPAIFIPFPIRPEDGVTVGEQVRYWSAQFGHIYYRDVIPTYAANGVTLSANDASIFCDRLADQAELSLAVNDLLDKV